jgi:hypothetical protein
MIAFLKRLTSLWGRGLSAQSGIGQKLSHGGSCQSPSQSSQQTKPQALRLSYRWDKPLYTVEQIPSIYSGIGMGVYVWGAVAIRQMAVGEKRWILSRLRFDDLGQLPPSMSQYLRYLACLLDVHHEQSDLVKNGLQTKSAIELGQYYCQQAQHQFKSVSSEGAESNHAVLELRDKGQQQGLSSLQCPRCPFCGQSNTVDKPSQPKDTLNGGANESKNNSSKAD